MRVRSLKLNNRKCKALRKIVFKNKSEQRDREFVKIKSSGVIINIAHSEPVEDGIGKPRKIPKRRIYRHLKRVSNNIKIALLKKVFLSV